MKRRLAIEMALPPRLFVERLDEGDYSEDSQSFVPSGARSPNRFMSGAGSPQRSGRLSQSPIPVGRGSGRLSPMPMGFKPIVARGSSFEVDDAVHSYAGQMNPADLRGVAARAAGGYDPERMINQLTRGVAIRLRGKAVAAQKPPGGAAQPRLLCEWPRARDSPGAEINIS